MAEEWIRNVGRSVPALTISQEPGAKAKGNPALALVQADTGGPAMQIRSAGTMLDCQLFDSTSKFKVDGSGNVTVAGTIAAASGGAGALLTSMGAQVASLYAAPAGATGETTGRPQATGATTAITTSGTVYLTAIVLAQGLLVANVSMVTGTGTLKTGGTHGWYCLADSGLVVRAASADQTDAATKWGTASTVYTLPMANAYTTTYTGLYYVGVMVANSAGTQPNIVSAASLATGIVSIAPVLSGPSSGGTGTGQTTPPATDGSVTLGAISADSARRFYAWTS